jgi:hypothetical protein
MTLIWNHLNTLLVTAIFAKNMANHLTNLSLCSIIISILTTVLLLTLYILIEAQSYI